MPLTSLTPDLDYGNLYPLPVNVSIVVGIADVDADTMIDNCTVTVMEIPPGQPGEPIRYRHVIFDADENGSTVSGSVFLSEECISIYASAVEINITCSNGLQEIETLQRLDKKAAVHNVTFTSDTTVGPNVTFTIELEGK